jgi:NADH dehydrogenase
MAPYKNVRTVMGEVTGFDLDGRRVLVAGEQELVYDYLVVAAGARHHYFGHDEWEATAPGLKTIEDATAIRGRVLSAFEAAEVEPDPEKRRALLTFLIVGGGPTGVELAGTLGEIANDTLKEDFRSFRPEEARIQLLEAGPRILTAFPEHLGAAAERSLLALGVRVRTGVAVSSIDGDGVKLANGDQIPAKTVVWAAGVKASPLGAMLGAELDKAGRVVVTTKCRLPGRPEVFVLGDMAALQGMPLPGVAPVAMQQGRYVADAIEAVMLGREFAPFAYVNKGNLATIGRAKAIADFGTFQLSGWVAWLLWLFIHIMYLVGFRNRVQVFVHWAFQYLTFNRGARLITGERP